jgi:phage protein U
MWAQIGSVRIEIITIFEEMDGQHGHDYPQHEVIEGKPLLQWMGGKLSSYRLRYHLHCGMTTSPRQQFEILKQMMDEHKAVPFIKGMGTFMGTYVITDLTDDYLFETDRGGTVEMKGEMTLLEYVSEGPASELAAKAAATKASISTQGLPNVLPTVVRLPTDTPSTLSLALSGLNQIEVNPTGFIGSVPSNSAGDPLASSFIQLAGSSVPSLNSVMTVFATAANELPSVLANITGVQTKELGVTTTAEYRQFATGVVNDGLPLGSRDTLLPNDIRIPKYIIDAAVAEQVAIAIRQADIATTQADLATLQAGIATEKAVDASLSAESASNSAGQYVGLAANLITTQEIVAENHAFK